MRFSTFGAKTIFATSFMLMGLPLSHAAKLSMETDLTSLSIQPNTTIEVDYFVTNETFHQAYNHLLLKNLPAGVVQITDNEDPTECGPAPFALQPQETCTLRLAVTVSIGTTTVKPKVCGQADCNDIWAKGAPVAVTANASLVAPEVPMNVALIRGGQTNFEIYNNDSNVHAFTLTLPEEYADLVGEVNDDNCVAVAAATKCAFALEDITLENPDVRYSAQAVVHGDEGAADQVVRLWWNAVQVNLGDEQHLQYQSMVLSKSDIYPGNVEFDNYEYYSVGNDDDLDLCDTDATNCQYYYPSDCDLLDSSIGNSCTQWYEAQYSDDQPFVEEAAAFYIDLMENDVGTNDLDIFYYSREFSADYSVGLYAGINGYEDVKASALNLQVWKGSGWNPVPLGPQGDVNALTVYNGDLIVGGDFENAGNNQVVNNIVAWTGQDWEPLTDGQGTGVTGNAGEVHALLDYIVINFDKKSNTLFYDDRLVVGGEFSHAGETTANNVAFWGTYPFTKDNSTATGEIWFPLDDGDVNGTPGPVYALEQEDFIFADKQGLDVDTIYVGGQFTQINDNGTAYNVAAFDVSGGDWYPLNNDQPPCQSYVQGAVYALEFGEYYHIDDLDAGTLEIADVLYTGGNFSQDVCYPYATYGQVKNISAYDLDIGQWAPLEDSTVSQVNGVVYSLVYDGGYESDPARLYVGGDFTQTNEDGETNSIVGWQIDPNAWFALEDNDDNINGIDGAVYSMLTYFDEYDTEVDVLYTGGRFDQAGNSVATNVAGWNSEFPFWFNGLSLGDEETTVKAMFVSPAIVISELED